MYKAGVFKTLLPNANTRERLGEVFASSCVNRHCGAIFICSFYKTKAIPCWIQSLLRKISPFNGSRRHQPLFYRRISYLSGVYKVTILSVIFTSFYDTLSCSCPMYPRSGCLFYSQGDIRAMKRKRLSYLILQSRRIATKRASHPKIFLWTHDKFRP